MKLALCILQVVLCLSLIRKMYLRDKVNAVFLGVLFIYTIFPEINYAYYPDFISKYVNKSEGNWYTFFFFTTLSFIALYLFDVLFLNVKFNFKVVVKDSFRGKARLSYIIIFIYSAILIVSIFIIIRNWSALSYSSNVLRSYSRIIGFVRAMNDWNVYYFIIMVTAIKKAENGFRKNLMKLSCLLCVIALALFTLGTGDRSVIFLCLIGWFIYYFYDKPLAFSSIKKMIPFIVIAVGYLFIIRIVRSSNTNGFDFIEDVLQDDYAYPGMTLIAAINGHFIDPISVIRAFITKGSIIFRSEKYLYWILYKAEFPAFIEQAKNGTNPGIAFHLFTEGYIFCGFMGFIYNGLFISILLRFWRHFYTTNDEQTNIVVAAIAAGIFSIGVRSESAYFVRNFALYMMPALILYLLTCDKRISISHNRMD